MAGKNHPYIEVAKISIFVFLTMILIIVFMALYVGETFNDNEPIAPARVEKALTPPGKLYSR